MIRIGVAGLGMMGQMHLASYIDHPNVSVDALCDVDKDRREGRFQKVEGNIEGPAKELKVGKVRSYVDPMEMAKDEELDAISICLPSHMHADLAVTAMESGKHVFCEKPLALNVRQGKRMLDAARRTGRSLMVGHVLRFWPEYAETHKIISSGKYGKTLAASFSRCSPFPSWTVGGDNWFVDPEKSGGPIVDLHIHDVDVCVWWWGKPSKITASGALVKGVPTFLQSQWQYENGPVVQHESSWEMVTTSPFYAAFKISMEKATLLFDSRTGDGLQLASAKTLKQVKVKDVNAYELEDKYFINCLTRNKPFEQCPPEESLISLDCCLREARKAQQSRKKK